MKSQGTLIYELFVLRILYQDPGFNCTEDDFTEWISSTRASDDAATAANSNFSFFDLDIFKYMCNTC